MLTIVTPTYNRSKELKKLFESLNSQSTGNFTWLIIDDGSIDDTEKSVKDFMKFSNSMKIIYKKIDNSGKHVALNLAFSMVTTELIMIVDSDDYLEKNAVEIIEKDWMKYRNKKLCGLCYQRIKPNGKIICSMPIEQGNAIVGNYNDFIINKNIIGDKAEVFRSDVLKKYRFPVFKGEKFLGEGVMWSKIAHKYDMIFINKHIYVCDYLNEGLTMSGRRMRIKNPLGGMYHAEEYLNKRYKLKIREKNALLFISYAFFARKKVMKLVLKHDHSMLLFFNYIFGYCLYKYWYRKYGDKNA